MSANHSHVRAYSFNISSEDYTRRQLEFQEVVLQTAIKYIPGPSSPKCTFLFMVEDGSCPEV